MFRRAAMEKKKPIVELELYLIRHGQSQGNVGYDKDELTPQEQHDPILTEKGVMQAQLAGKHLSSVDFDRVYSSGLLRAVRTATEILNKQPTEKPLYIFPHLAEAGLSAEYETTLDTLHEINPLALLAPELDSKTPLLIPSDNKDDAGLFKRAGFVLEHLREHFNNGEKIALVSHAAFLTFIVFSIMGFTTEAPFYDINFANTGITRVILYKKGTNPYGDVVFDYINNTEHLGNI